MARRSKAAPKRTGVQRGEETRRALLDAATDIFGRKGYEASTREIAAAAGVNLAAIPYYFGTKDDLYIACAEGIAQRMLAHVGPRLDQAQARLRQSPPDDPEAAREVILGLLNGLASAMVDTESATWARFIIREQMEPTEAFERIYNGVMTRLLTALRQAIARAGGIDPDSQEAGLRAIAAVSQVLVFRAARAAVLRQLGWRDIGPPELDAIQSAVERAADTALR